MNDMITEDGEVLTGTAMAVIDTTALSAIVRAEIDTQIATARAYPRSVDRAIKNILSLTTMDEETAEEAIYALPRGGKPIRGPSVRLAETVAQSWGNCRVDARVVMVDRNEKVIVAEGLFHDLETNMATRATVRRRITDKRGQLYNDDMIAVTGNAACSIAKRNAILAGIPKPVWRKAYQAAEKVIAGDQTTLTVTRDKAIAALAHFGLTPEQVFQIIGVRGLDDISLDHIPTLRGTFSGLKNGETTVEELLRTSKPTTGSSSHEKVSNPLADDAPAPEETKAEPAKSEAAPAESETSAPKASPEEEADRLGYDARGRNVSKKAIPGELRSEERKAEASAWQAGWDRRDAEMKAAQ